MPTRYLRDVICESEAINSLSPESEVLFYRLIVKVDDFGRVDARPVIIRSKCYPLKVNMQVYEVENLLVELHQKSLITIYAVNGRKFIQINKWNNKARSKISKCPDLNDKDAHAYSCMTNAYKCMTNVPETGTGTGTGTDRKKERKKETPLIPSDEPVVKSTRSQGSRLTIESLPDEWRAFCQKTRPSSNPDTVFEVFRDYWIAQPASKGVKLDWFATWRNWVRRESAPQSSGKPAHVSRDGFDKKDYGGKL